MLGSKEQQPKPCWGAQTPELGVLPSLREVAAGSHQPVELGHPKNATTVWLALNRFGVKQGYSSTELISELSFKWC